ncbi:uncharacterized protein JCM15063_002264 [Sporobolomyces koalae]|uniref:uncharacterized protein n=1 Tax=Sporobolomyces koalae TaxID=500713 RepID=UPI00317B2E55
MSSTPTTAGSSATAHVHQHLHLAPAYALSPQLPASLRPTASTTPSSSARLASRPSSTVKGKAVVPEPRPWQPEDLRALVLEYLLSECCGDTAEAFANEIDTRERETQSHAAEHDPASSDEHDMQGVEATPPPEDWSKPENDEQSHEVDDHCNESRGILSRERLRDVRLRQGKPTDDSVNTSAELAHALSTAIRESVLQGRIAQTISLLNEHYPQVLAPSVASSPLKFAPPHHQSAKQTTSCTPSTFFVLSETAVSPATLPLTPKPSIPIVGATFGSWATSTAPEILSLNLQLQAFVELMRTGHATSALSTPSTPTSSVAGGQGGSGSEDAGMSSSVASLASSTTSTSLLSTAITASQSLLTSIRSLPPSKDKESFERECVDVCGLLAYKDLTNCPVRGYLEMSRREGLAEMVNSAILQRTNRTPLPLLALAARQATATWQTLAELKVQFPPVPATSSTTNQNGTTKTKVTKTYPVFDFAQFVNSNPTDPPKSIE